MGKRRAKSGMTGLSGYVATLNQDQDHTEVPPTLASTERHAISATLGSNKQSGYTVDPAGRNGDSTEAHPVPNQSQTLKNMRLRYDATGLVPFYEHLSQVPDHLKKYFSQRTRYFSLYDKPPGCLLDEEGWYSITPERVADQIAERCRCDVVLDAFCGVGGNTIALAKTCERVIALDTNPTRLALARHNAEIYGVADRIEFILADYLSFARAYLLSKSASPPNRVRKIDTVFLSPPWGGPSYLSGATAPPEDGQHGTHETTNTNVSHPTYSLSSVQPIHGRDIFLLTRKITPNIAYYLPRNTDLSEVSGLLNGLNEQGDAIQLPGEKIEVEEEWMGNKLKALTCYFGGLVPGQEHLF